MNIKQISVFLENKKGRLTEVTKILADANISIKALSLADTSDFGILRLIVTDPAACRKELQQNNIVAQETDVIAVEVEDKPGGLHKVLLLLQNNNINVEYMYATVEKAKNFAVVIFRVDEIEKTINLLTTNHIRLVRREDLKNL
jgi:hypothetical protein